MERSNAASSQLSTGCNLAIPALMNRMSIWPNAWLMVCANARCAARSVESDPTTCTSAPNCSRATSRVCGLAPVTITRAPSLANWRAVSRPMPVVPPVIRVRLPFSLSISELAHNLVEEPRAPLGLVDPDLDEAGCRHVAMPLACFVCETLETGELPVIVEQVGQHIPRRETIAV